MSNTTVTIQERRFHPEYLAVKVPHRELLNIKITHMRPLLIAPPSPWYAGQNTDINTEPFPAFVDICPPIKAEALHCVRHCRNDICRRLERYKDVPPCRCGDEIFQSEPIVNTPASPRPEITAEDMFQPTLLHNCSPPQEITIHREDARQLLKNFARIARKRVLRDTNFMALVRERWEDPEKAAEHIVFCLFILFGGYFKRTMRNAEVRNITPNALRAELKFYLATGLDDWIYEYCDEVERELVMDISGGDPRCTLEAADFGVVGAVAQLWKDCLNDLVLLFVLRDARVRQVVAEQPPLWAVVLVGIWISVVQFFSSCFNGVSNKMPSNRPIKI